MKKLPMGLVIAFISMAVLVVSGCVTAEQQRLANERDAAIDRIKCSPERKAKELFKAAPQRGNFIGVSVVSTGVSSAATAASAKASGSSGCHEKTKKSSFYLQQQEFVAVTIDNLSEQIAQGGGPHLQSLAALLGCPASDYSKLATMTRQSYGQLFPSAETEPEVFLVRLKEEMRCNPSLAGRCVYS